MKIECYMSSGCGPEQAARRNIEAALNLEGASAETVFSRITEDEAMALGLRGSPSVLIDGKEYRAAGNLRLFLTNVYGRVRAAC